jgi:hypothetical protein
MGGFLLARDKMSQGRGRVERLLGQGARGKGCHRPVGRPAPAVRARGGEGAHIRCGLGRIARDEACGRAHGWDMGDGERPRISMVFSER